MKSPDDHELVQRILDGDQSAWHDFVHRYSRLISSVLRRYLPGESEEHRRTIYVDVLTLLRKEKLQAYDGSVALSTWVTLIARRCGVDDLRTRIGRRHQPKWLEEMDELDRELFRMYHLDGLGYPEILDQLRQRYPSLDVVELTQRFDRISHHLNQSFERRMAYDLSAHSSGAVSGRILEYIDGLKLDRELGQSEGRPDAGLEAEERCAQLERLRAVFARLCEHDRDVLQRFYEGRHSAKRIAADLGLAGQRRAYTVIARAIRRLRRLYDLESGSSKSKRGGNVASNRR